MTNAFLVDPLALENPSNDFRNSVRYTLGLKDLKRLVKAKVAEIGMTPDMSMCLILFVYLEVINGKMKQTDLRDVYFHFDRVLSKYHSNVTVLAIRALYRVMLHEPGAESDAKRCVAILPEFGAPRFALAILHARQNQLSESVKMIEGARFAKEYKRVASYFPELDKLESLDSWKKIGAGQ